MPGRHDNFLFADDSEVSPHVELIDTDLITFQSRIIINLAVGLVQITSVRPASPASTLADSRSNGAGSGEPD